MINVSNSIALIVEWILFGDVKVAEKQQEIILVLRVIFKDLKQID
jgi:hypothetical protein